MSRTRLGAYHDRLRRQGCTLCRMLGGGDAQAVEIHPPRFAAGTGQRASGWLAIPLCPACHRGPQGIHGDRALLAVARTDEAGLLAATIAIYHAEAA